MRLTRRMTSCTWALTLLSAGGGATAEDVVTAGEDDPAYEAELYRPAAHATMTAKEPLALKPGPHLLIDDHLIDKTTNVTRRVNCPARDPSLPNPLVTGEADFNFQPYMTILRDPETGRFRIWYGARTQDRNTGRSHITTMASDDGIHWERPPRLLDDPGPIQFGCCVLDDGPGFADPAARYKYAWYSAEGDGLRIAISPNGSDWRPMTRGIVLRHSHDINNIFRDPLRNRYMATVSVYTEGPTWSGKRRATMHSASQDLIHWEKPWYVVTPDDSSDPTETQFYAMNGYLVRGELMIGLVKVLHDNWRAEGTPEGSFGVGHTQLAWSRDGKTWVRDQTPFFEPDPAPGAWDHAHAWMDWQLPVGDQVYIYYAGYKNGHKVNRFEERQIGLVRILRDRYVSRDADGDGGTLITQPVTFEGNRMTVNARVGGSLRVRLLTVDGEPIPGFDAMVRGDGVALPVEWPQPLSGNRDRPVRIEFQMKSAQLYALDVEE
ncbi:MAG: hypothetical protein JXP34_18410 [Planctomycetes bacterium]|nr:hypothetical protein [Planctomycetota bacterium]